MNKKLFCTSVLSLLFLGLQAQTKIGGDILTSTAWDQSGCSVSISGDGSIVAVGAKSSSTFAPLGGHGRVFKYSSGAWKQVGQDINGSNQDMMGASTAISADGKIVAFGASFADAVVGVLHHDCGIVRVYDTSSGDLVQVGGDINGLTEMESSGSAISLSGDGSIIAIGVPSNSTSRTQSGVVRVYRKTAEGWVLIGSEIGYEDGNNDPGDHFGYSVSLSADGSTVAVGAPKDDLETKYPGKVKVFKNFGDNWIQIGSNLPGGGLVNQFGKSVSLSGDGTVLAVGAGSGQMRIYRYRTEDWEQIGNDINGEYVTGKPAPSVSISADGSIVAIGSSNDNKNGIHSGQTRIFKNANGNWNKIGYIAGETAGDFSGYSVSLSSNGLSVAIGAPTNSQGGENAGKATVYDLSALLSTDPFTMTQTSIYPNPVKNKLNVTVDTSLLGASYMIYDQLGRAVLSGKLNEETSVIEMGNLAKGVYFLSSGDKAKTATKFIKE